MKRFLTESLHTATGRAAVVKEDDETVWAYLLESTEGPILADCWVYNLIEAPTNIPPRYKEEGLPPPVVAYHAGPGARLAEVDPDAFELRWSEDGTAAGVLHRGRPVAIVQLGTRGYARGLARTGPWGQIWSDEVWRSLIGEV